MVGGYGDLKRIREVWIYKVVHVKKGRGAV